MAEPSLSKDFKGYSILIVDDEEAIANLMATRMSLIGFEAFAVGGGDEAFDKYTSQPVDVIISDVRMNNGDGLHLAKKLQAGGHDPVMVFVTAFADITVPEAQSFGVSGIFSKPIDFDELCSHLKQELQARDV